MSQQPLFPGRMWAQQAEQAHTLAVWGLKPMSQPRPRTGASGGFYSPKGKGLKAWEELIVLTARSQPWWPNGPPWTGPWWLGCMLFFKKPKALALTSTSTWPEPMERTPDRDNAEKPIMDCLTRAGLWADDALICQGPVEKWWAAPGKPPGAIITLAPAGSWEDLHGDWRPWDDA